MGRIGPYICSPCHDYRSGKSPATEFHLLELTNVDKFRLTGARSSEGPGVQHRPVNVWTFWGSPDCACFGSNCGARPKLGGEQRAGSHAHNMMLLRAPGELCVY